MPEPAPTLLADAQRALRSRFDDFQGAFGRRDEVAARVALSDFHARLKEWTAALEAGLLPALAAASTPRRDLQRELSLDFVQQRELTRYLSEQIWERAPLSDILGLIQNLDRRMAAHAEQMDSVYAAAAAAVLSPEGWETLRRACPEP
ncbi:MAG: hypothetical protein ABR610_10040 [Thermoanaerobaculia bacterium]